MSAVINEQLLQEVREVNLSYLVKRTGEVQSETFVQGGTA